MTAYVSPRALLRRKKLKGEEVGRALLESLVHDYHQRGNPKSNALFTQQELTQMVAMLPSEYERGIYSTYACLYDELVSLFRQSQGMLQQLQHGLFRLTVRIDTANRVEQLVCGLTIDVPVKARDELASQIHTYFIEDFESIAKRPELRKELRAARDELVLPAYTWLIGYNAMLDIYAKGVSIPLLHTLRALVETVWAEAESYDIKVAACIDRLPGGQAQALRDACPPLGLGDIQAHADFTALYLESIEKNGPGLLSPQRIIETVVRCREQEAEA